MKPLSERDENIRKNVLHELQDRLVGMKPLSERDENNSIKKILSVHTNPCRNEATLWKRWEPPILQATR